MQPKRLNFKLSFYVASFNWFLSPLITHEFSRMWLICVHKQPLRKSHAVACCTTNRCETNQCTLTFMAFTTPFQRKLSQLYRCYSLMNLIKLCKQNASSFIIKNKRVFIMLAQTNIGETLQKT